MFGFLSSSFPCVLPIWAEEELIKRPVDLDGGATKVYVAGGLLDIDEIDSAEQNFTVNLFFSTR